jgi:hypothetical protein
LSIALHSVQVIRGFAKLTVAHYYGPGLLLEKPARGGRMTAKHCRISYI